MPLSGVPERQPAGLAGCGQPAGAEFYRRVARRIGLADIPTGGGRLRRATILDRQRDRPDRDASGHRAAALYPLIETARLNGINPQLYTADALARIGYRSARRIGDLLPWNRKPADIARCLTWRPSRVLMLKYC